MPTPAVSFKDRAETAANMLQIPNMRATDTIGRSETTIYYQLFYRVDWIGRELK